MTVPLWLNGFEVDARIVTLMDRVDWPLERTSKAWLNNFPASKDQVPFIQFFTPEHAIRENAHIRKSELKILNGKPRQDVIPGDFDPTAGYLIGMVDYVDAAIAVDLRVGPEPRIIYDTMSSGADVVYSTAFKTLSSFINFYMSQHS
ncbi:MAG: hypothetical protein V4564_19735 [Pseudomonadota bacterium]|uniref:hypothetical protein n=1 Tax=Sphingomonas sp. ERG5 TaxID=1381597 RepID=UPI00054B9482|nr:hypothetical protein [Sphingomonas sp. ERG5]